MLKIMEMKNVFCAQLECKYNLRHDVHRFKNEWFIFPALKYRM